MFPPSITIPMKLPDKADIFNRAINLRLERFFYCFLPVSLTIVSFPSKASLLSVFSASSSAAGASTAGGDGEEEGGGGDTTLSRPWKYAISKHHGGGLISKERQLTWTITQSGVLAGVTGAGWHLSSSRPLSSPSHTLNMSFC